MKKVGVFIFTLLFFGVKLLAQSNEIFDGYNGFKWGTSVEEIKKKYPTLKDITTPKFRAEHQTCFEYIRDENYYRAFFFFDGKFYKGKTLYGVPYQSHAEAIIEAIYSKLAETYGINDELSKQMENIKTEKRNDYDYATIDWFDSPALSVKLELWEYKGNQKEKSHIIIINSSPEIENELENFIKEKFANDLEL